MSHESPSGAAYPATIPYLSSFFPGDQSNASYPLNMLFQYAQMLLYGTGQPIHGTDRTTPQPGSSNQEQLDPNGVCQ